MKIYLDVCCFNRPFDEQRNVRVKLETEAKLEIQAEIRAGKYHIVWSNILDYENSRNPHVERRLQIEGWKKYAAQDIEENNKILAIANKLSDLGLKSLDSLHVACAIESNCTYFISTDDKILNRQDKIKEIEIIDLYGFIREQTP